MQVLVIEDITHLIAHNSGIANCRINIGVRMTVYPDIYTAAGNEVAQLCCKSAVD